MWVVVLAETLRSQALFVFNVQINLSNYLIIDVFVFLVKGLGEFFWKRPVLKAIDLCYICGNNEVRSFLIVLNYG